MIAAAAACVLLAVSGAAGDLFGGLKVEQDEPAMAAAGSADSPSAAMEDLAPAAQDPEDTGKARIAPPAAEPETGNPPAPSGSDAPGGQNTAGDKEQTAPPAGEPEAAPEPATFVSPRLAADQNAAGGLAVTVPDELLTHSYGFCYVAVGSSTPPALEQATLIEKDGNTYYFKIENSMTVLEKLGNQLQEAGYETALRSDVGITTDESAKDSLLIVSVTS